jgi:hypothetical protein
VLLVAVLGPVMEPDGQAHGKDDDKDLESEVFDFMPKGGIGIAPDAEGFFGVFYDLLIRHGR